MDDQLSNTSHLTIQELPQVVQELFALANHELLPGSTQPWRLFAHYLRRKPGRGLAVIYLASEVLPPSQRASAARQTISLTIEEQALAGMSTRITTEQARNIPLEQPSTGIVRARDLGIALQAFPADSNLPTLAACCATSAHSPLLLHLQEAARLMMGNGWYLLTAQATPIRYKPASRCVIRYDLTLAHPGENSQTRAISLFGKVYADAAQARAVQNSMQQLYTEQIEFPDSTITEQAQQTPFLPRPLLFVASLSLLLNETIHAVTPGGTLRTGTNVLRPQVIWERGGKTVAPVPPTNELRLAALALARLHTSGSRSGEHSNGSIAKDMPLRTGAKEAKRAHERAALLSGYYPAQAANIQDLAQTLAQRLEGFQPEAYRPAHGGFKASQLLYHDDTVSIVDFDGFCLADPALDVGYFLAYLRPSGIWYGRQGTRPWFEAASAIFITTYVHALQDLGVSSEEAAGILQRAQLYAAALLFKIATRRVNRLNSPRTHELAGMLKEIASCLALTRRME